MKEDRSWEGEIREEKGTGRKEKAGGKMEPG